ncbi:MAG: calcium-binding protein [Rhodobacterales bacterium]|nr:calcium-binding protein [Rhodobacterales bacterium]NCT11323.1 calcium-binding protein [Rhodobacterales bacterium]
MVTTIFGLEATLTLTEENDYYVFATIRDDVIAGLGGDDIIIGGTGTDFIDGGAGNDMAAMQVSLANAALSIDAQGYLVVSSVGGILSFRHTLGNIERVQFLTLDEYDIGTLIARAGGTPPPSGQTFTGTNGADQLFGTSGDDLFRPLFGPDIVSGGPGDDRLELPTTLERTGVFATTPNELAFRGNVGTQGYAYTVRDVETFVFADGATYTFAQMVALANNNTGEPLPDPTPGPDVIEGTSGDDTIKGAGGNDTLRGAGGNDSISGGAGRDTLSGDAGNDILSGGAGNDTLYGGDGNDRLLGGGGRDLINGGRGVDSMTGNRGADTFVFDDRDTGLKAAKRDVITDFGGRDVIDLQQVDASRGLSGDQAFTFSGTTASAQGIWYAVAGGNATVFGDTNGDARADFAITLIGVTSLNAADFIL